MSIRKTSILALSVLLSYESFAAAPTVLATTPRLGVASQSASTGRGKVTSSISIGGGLNKLTSNRGQSSFTPSGLPSDKQNELIENFQKEIQTVRDAVVEELRAQNEKIMELEEIIEEKDEKIAKLEDSIDEKIENSGFMTVESVASEIQTVKEAAVAQAKTAALAEVEKKGFVTNASVQNLKEEIAKDRAVDLQAYAKSATIASDIKTAKEEAVTQAKTAALKEVHDMGYAKSATIASEIQTAKDAAVAQAKTAAIEEVRGMGYAKSADVSEEVAAAKNAAIASAKNAAIEEVRGMGYATTSILAADIATIKKEITSERDEALKSYAKSAAVSEEVTAAKNAAITSAKNAAIEEVRGMGYATTSILAADIATIKKEITSERDEALKSYVKSAAIESEIQTAKDAAVALAKTAAIEEVRGMGYATSEKLESDIATIKTEIAKDRDEALKSYAKSADVLEEVATAKNAAITTAKNEAIEEVRGMGYALASDITTVRTEIAKDLQAYAKSEDLTKAVNDANTAIENEATTRSAVVATLATKEDLQKLELGLDDEELENMIDGRLQGRNFITQDTLNTSLEEYVPLENLSGRIADLTGNDGNPIFVKPGALNDFVKTADFGETLSKDTTFSALNSEVTNLKKPGVLGSLLKDDNGDSIFVTAADFGKTLSQNETFSKLNTTVNGFDSTYVKSENLSNELETTLANKKYLSEDSLNEALANKKYLSESALDDALTQKKYLSESALDDALTQKKYLSESALNDALAKKEYLSAKDIEDKTSSLGSALNAVRSAANTAQTTASAAQTTASAAQNTANTATSSISSLNSSVESLNTKVTSVETDLASKANSDDVVTKSSLTQDLVDNLTAVGTCGASSNPTDQLKSLLNGTFETCGGTGDKGGTVTPNFP